MFGKTVNAGMEWVFQRILVDHLRFRLPCMARSLDCCENDPLLCLEASDAMPTVNGVNPLPHHLAVSKVQ